MVIRKLLILFLVLFGVFVIPVNAQLMDSSWPMFGMNLQHTSQSLYTSCANGTVKWIYTTGNSIYSSPAIDSDGIIYFGSDDDKLYAIYPNGALKWSYTTGNDVESSPAIASDGTIYVGSWDNKFYALNPDGTLKWNYLTSNTIRSAPSISPDGTVYIAPIGKLYAFNPDGTEKWNYTTGGWDYSSPAIASDGTIYIDGTGYHVHAIHPNGTLKWTYTASETTYASPAIGSDGTIYFTDHSGTLYAVNPDGSTKWTNCISYAIYSSPSISLDGTIYIGTTGNYFYSFTSEGVQNWVYNLGGSYQTIWSAPTIGADGTIYIGSTNDEICALNPNGTLKWSYPTGGSIYSSVVIAQDGTLYGTSGDGKLYSFISVASAASPEFDDVSWNKDPYFAYDTANITTNIVDFDDTTYNYYLDLYSEQEYLTTYPIHSETESNYYTFSVSGVDTGLLAELQRVTEPYGTNEVNLARDLSHFEVAGATSIVFNKSSYAPGESLSVMWTGAPTGSTVWLWCGADGYVIENDVSYSDSLSFDIPSDSEESYYIVDVIVNGIIIATDSCEIFSIPDYVFDRNVSVDQDEYVHGDWVTVTYSTDSPAVIKVFDDTNADIWHYLDVPAAVTNETWVYYIGDTDPFGSFSVLFGNDNFLVSDYYSIVSSTSFVEVVPESMFMYETMRIWYVTNGSSTLSIKDSSDSILFNQTVNSSSLESISYIPTVSGILTITLSDVPADATDSIIVYWAEDPDDLPDEDVIDDDVIEDVLEDDETMTEYYNEKFRDFAPTIWGFFMLMCLLFLMSILTSFNSGGKRR